MRKQTKADKNRAWALRKVLETKYVVYPKPRHHAILVALCFDEELKKSELGRNIFAQFVERMPETTQNALLGLYKKMTPEQRSRPHQAAKNGF